ncbi:MAG: ABC transporter permease [Methanobacteriota archaeon]|nr:MAG: ABC transporter permease [Euryarchaeota archaeon]
MPQAILILIIAIGFYSMTLNGSPLLYTVILILASLVGLSFGLLFSIISKTKEQAVQLVPFVILIFIVLAGELILFENMSSPLRQIAENLPLSLANQSLKAIMLHGKGFQSVFGDLVKLILWIISLNVIAFIRFYTEK